MLAMYMPTPLLFLLAAAAATLSSTSTSAAAVSGSAGTAVDKEAAPVADVKTDLLSLEQEIGGSAVLRTARRARGLLWAGAAGYPFGASLYGFGAGLGFGVYPSYGYPSYYGSSPYYGYGGYYPGYYGYQKIIIG